MNLKNGSRVKNKTGNKYGFLTVLDDYYVKDKHFTYWKCHCSACGKDKFILNTSLCRIKTCGCQNHPKGNNSHSWKGYKEITGEFFGVLKIRARNRGIKFNLTMKDLWDLYESQDRKCIFTGRPLNFPKGGKSTFKNCDISLDRINNKKGYIKENVQLVCKDINCMKWTKTNIEFINTCKEIVKYCT